MICAKNYLSGAITLEMLYVKLKILGIYGLPYDDYIPYYLVQRYKPAEVEQEEEEN